MRHRWTGACPRINHMEITGDVLVRWARLATSALQDAREEINALNVFPVPDSDTGSNMAHTMQAALAEAEQLSETASFQDIAQALATGAVRGARGNSGVVLSQVFRGLAGVTGPSADLADVASSLNTAVRLVTEAIADPQEGTVLTVLRVAAEAASAPDATIDRVIIAANRALAETPSQLAELRRAGVVDAGGRGLCVILGALGDALSGGIGEHIAPDIEVHGSYLEVMFYFQSDTFDEDVTAFDGDSFMVARDTPSSGTIHVHTRRAGELITEAFSRGTVTHLRIEALPEDPRESHVDIVVPDVAHEFFPEASTLTHNRGTSMVYVSCGLPIPVEVPLTAEVIDTNNLVEAVAAVSMFDPHAPHSQAVETMQRAAMQVTSAEITRAPGNPAAWCVRSVGHGEVSASSAEEAVCQAIGECATPQAEVVTIIGPVDTLDMEKVTACVSEVTADLVTHESETFFEIGVE